MSSARHDTRAQRVWVTRDEDVDGPLSTALCAAGHIPIVESVLETVRLLPPSALETQLAALGPEDWLVLTSARAVAGLPRVPVVCLVAVVGEATHEAATRRGLTVTLVAPDGTAQSLWRALSVRAHGRRVLFPRSELAKVPSLPGIEVAAPALYTSRPRTFDVGVVERIDAATFASPSAVQAARAALELLVQRAIPIVSIGPTTTAVLRACGVPAPREAATATFAAVAADVTAR